MSKSKYNKKYPYAIGIDLGTSNSCVAVKVGKEIKVVDAKEGISKQGKTLASCVSFTQSEVLVGDFAKNRLVIAPEETVYQAKRVMGTTKTWTIRGKTYRPEQISAYILTKLKEAVQQQVEAEITEVVITVPAQFDDLQRKATEDAAKIAGLNCIRLINEPTAAALAYQFNNLKEAQNILVADLGGGTFDVSILKCEQTVFSVIATGGDTKLGGKDIDEIMIDYARKQITAKYDFSIKEGDVQTIEKIRTAVEETKITLSNVSSTELIIPFLGLKDNKPVSVSIPYSRVMLQQQIRPILEKIKKAIISTVQDSKLSLSTLNRLLLVGGPMNMPILKTTIEQTVNLKASTSLNPNNCVAIGAARQAANLSNYSQQENNDSILLLDVTPLSLGLAVEGNMMSKIIEKNSNIPIKNVMKYTTAEDNQQSVEIRILQGERPLASDNKLLHTFSLNGIPKMKRGAPIIEVTFEINASGVLSVRAEQSTTKVSQQVTVVENKNLSKQQIEQMIKDAEINKEKDEENKKVMDTIHKGKSLIFSLQDAKSNEKLTLTEEDKANIDQYINSINELCKQVETSKQIQKLEDKMKQVETLLLTLLRERQSNKDTSEPTAESEPVAPTE